MNLQQLRYVVAVANNGSFREAARKMFITQPSLSNGIKELEKELGLSLFVRTNQGAVLTADGKDFLARAEKILVQMDRLETRYQKKEPTERFSIASQHYDFLGSIIGGLIQRFPQYEEYRIMETTTAKVIEEVAEGHSEIGLLYMNEKNQKGLERYLEQAGLAKVDLGTFRTHIFVGKQHPLAEQKEIATTQLKDYSQVRFNQEGGDFDYFEEDPLKNQTKSCIVTNDRGTLTNILRTSDAYASGSGIVDRGTKEQIRLIPLAEEPLNHLYGIYPKQTKLSEIAEEFFFDVRTFIINSKKPTA
ncbi:LysR family transcriptional regulator [Enterococcus sp. JM9B]|uniref:LysR family transcriptional regulator n=1 Tax=Enterococcus sp. JM9B TaxID=1857216 RepID=UPI001374E4C5|nr:LysR family transcriptional regulator [Enterococcus sp. JM9B]KAF1302501.1 LysR family transcriptional regulator [Enterococcus sp. JM9B]